MLTQPEQIIPDPSDIFLDTEGLARRWGIGTTKVKDMAKDGLLPDSIVPGMVRIPLAALRAWEVTTSLAGTPADPARPSDHITVVAPPAHLFGAVHSGPTKRGRRRCACGRYHRADDARLGTPVDPDTYDYDASAKFNATLSRRFTVLMQKLRRLTDEPLDFVRVVEFQRRGLTHVHALVRGAVSPESLRVAVRGGTNPRTGRQVAAVTSGGFGFGPQCDAQPVTDVGRVGSYMRKLIRYAVKAAGDDLPDGSRHARAMAGAGARSVGCSDARPACCRDEPGRLNDPSWGSCRRHRAARRGWGFRGHVLTAPRHWGVKFSALRAVRRAWVAASLGPSRWAAVAFEVLPASWARPSWLRSRSP